MQLFVSIERQELDLRDDYGHLLGTYPVSTSRYGLGCMPGSNCTPLGRFRIVQKIGHGAPLLTIFQSRTIMGIWDGCEVQDDYVLTRILWLDGLDEPNRNTYSRYIYIHGTNQETLIGHPASHGCIRLRNADVAALFDQVDLATEVVIGEIPAFPSSTEEIL